MDRDALKKTSEMLGVIKSVRVCLCKKVSVYTVVS